MTTYIGAPSSLSSSSVTKYQHAKSVLSLARQVAQNFETWDNRDGVDLNTSTGSIVTKFPQPVLIRSQLAGALRQGQYASMSGSLTGHTLCASLHKSDGSGELQLTMQQTDEDTQVTFKSSPRKGHDFTPGTITVTENKATGSISIEQEQEFPWTFKYGPGVAEYEARFESSGPTSASDAKLYNLGIDVEKDIRAEMERAKALDGSSVDLNPQPGLVVLAGQKPIKSDNPVDTGFLCPSPYQVPTEVCLQFEPSSGEISKYARGFGDHNAVAYERTADRQIFETNAFLGFNRVEIGARMDPGLHQNFTSVERDTLKGHFRDDIEVDTSHFPAG